MKHVQVLLISAAVVVGGVAFYHLVVRAPPERAGTMDLDGTDDVGDAGGGRPAFDLTGRVADQERRIEGLEADLRGLRDDVERLAQAAEALRQEGRVARAPDPDAPLDEARLERLRVQMDELDRRREKKRQEAMVRRKLELLGVVFGETEYAAVLERMVRHNVDVGAFWTRVREEAIDDKDVIASEVEMLRNQAATDLRALLPREKAEVVVKGFGLLGPPTPR